MAVVSPGDVVREREAVVSVVEQLNYHFAPDKGYVLKVWLWETDAEPGLHEEGTQGKIDEGMQMNDVDVVIGIFWKRFGTPTGDAQSGTEHELRKAWASWRKRRRPDVLIYFSRQPAASETPETSAEHEQRLRVKRFRDDLPKEQVWSSYDDPHHFEQLVRNHLEGVIARRAKTAPPVDPKGAGDGERAKDRSDRLRRRRWLLALPVMAAGAAVAIVLAPGPSTSNAQIAKQWLEAFNKRDITTAASYWRTPALWTGLRGQSDPLPTGGDLKDYLQRRTTCHKVLEQVILDPTKSNVVRLRIRVDRSLPGLPAGQCRSINAVWDEDYLIEGSHIITLSIRAVSGSPSTPTGTSTGQSTASTTAGSPSGGATTGEAPTTSTLTSASSPATVSGSTPSGTTTVSQTSTPTLSTTLPTPPRPPG